MTASRRDFLRLSAAAGIASPLAGRLALASPQGTTGTGATKPKRILILGGTGFLGPHVVEAALARKHVPTLFNRGKTNPHLFPDLEKLHGDRKTAEGLSALKGRTWDAVVDTSGYFPRDLRASTEVLKDNVAHYVFISTVSVYDEAAKRPFDEEAPVGKTDDPEATKITGENYGPLKALCEKAAEDAMPGRVATIRPGLIVGPGDPTGRFTYWPVRVDRGGEVLAPGKPSDPVQIIDARDLAAWIVKVIEDLTVGVYNAVGPVADAPLGIGKMLDACNAVSGGKATFVWADAEFLAEQKVQPWQDMPVWVPPPPEGGGLSRTSFARAKAKGLRTRDLESICRDTLAWWKGLPEGAREKRLEGIKPEREKEVLAALRAKAPAK